jgi:hypothetical protein
MALTNTIIDFFMRISSPSQKNIYLTYHALIFLYSRHAVGYASAMQID